MYARKLDWGYFDHPPMIAILIKMGEFFGHGEFFMRLFPVLLGGFTTWGMWILCKKKDLPLFNVLFGSVTAFQLYGLIAVPDAPLLACSTWFFVIYKRFLKNDSMKIQMLLAFIIAALLYSKYHGILIVGFSVLAHHEILKKRSFFTVLLVFLVLYMSHIYWQIVNNLPSVQFHVLYKSQTSYNPVDTLLLPLQTLIMAGPIEGIEMFYAYYRNPSKTPMNRTYSFCFWGFLVFSASVRSTLQSKQIGWQQV